LFAEDARGAYLSFVAQVVISRVAWSLRCERDLIVLTGREDPFFPLWPDLESAQFFSGRHWPDLSPTRFSLKDLLRRHLPALERAGVPVGVGVAPYPEAIVLRARRLRRDLVIAKRAA
jgi:hypothetical protein